MRASRWSALFACASLFLIAPASAQSVKAGVDAWQRGDYVGAVAIWRPLAEAGDADAASTWARLTASAAASSST